MNDERLREAYERGLPRGDDRSPLDDLAGERLRRLVEQEGSDEERLNTVDALLSTAAGRADLEIVRAARRAARPRSAGRGWWAAAAAAAVVAVAIPATLLLTRENGPPVVRGESSPIALVAPRGQLEAGAARRFVWRALPAVDRYTVIVVDTAGQDVFVSETRDTAVQLPDSVRLVPGNQYLWWVQARTPAGEVVTALTERLSIAPQ